MLRFVAAATAAVLAFAAPGMIGSADADNGPLFLNVGPVPTGVRAGTPMTVIQFVKSGAVSGPAAPGKPVTLEVIDGPNKGQRTTITSDNLGQVIWRYSTDAAIPAGGTDTVRAWVDVNGNGAVDSGEPSNTNPFFVLPSANQPPVAQPVRVEGTAGEPIGIQLVGSDPDGRFVGFSIVTPPLNGTVDAVVTGSFVTYVPKPGFMGTDSFTYRVQDASGATDEARVDITVKPRPAVVQQQPVSTRSCDARNATLTIPAGQRVAFGTGGNDVIVALGDGVTVYGRDGDDVICLRGGSNAVYGGGGNDTVSLGNGNNIVYAGAGDDAVTAGNGRNRLFGGPGNDRIEAGNGNNDLYGDDGDDSLKVGTGFNTLAGGNSNDRLTAAARGNRLFGGQGDDEFFAPDRTGRA